MAMAVPSVMPPCLPPYSPVRRYPTYRLPQCKRLIENDSALRSCQAGLRVATTLSVVLMTWNSRSLPVLGTTFAKLALSRGSKPVKGSGCRVSRARVEPRNARTRRLRYIACSEKRLTLTYSEIINETTTRDTITDRYSQVSEVMSCSLLHQLRATHNAATSSCPESASSTPMLAAKMTAAM